MCDAVEVETFALENAFSAFKAVSSSIPTITDHTGETPREPCSMSFRTSTERSPVRNAMSTASIAAGSNSNTVAEVLMAAAAREPVQRPMTVVSKELGNGLDPSPWYLMCVRNIEVENRLVTHT